MLWIRQSFDWGQEYEMRLRYLAACVGVTLAASCGNPDDLTRVDPIQTPPASTASMLPTPTKGVQLFLRYEKDQHDLVKVQPGPCG